MEGVECEDLHSRADGIFIATLQNSSILPLSITEIIKALEIERDRQDITYLSVGETGVVVGGGGDRDVHGSYRGCVTCMGPTGVVRRAWVLQGLWYVHGSYRGCVPCMGPTGGTCMGPTGIV